MKKLILIAATALCSWVSEAAYLYWQVDTTDTSIVFESARVAYDNGSGTSGYLALADLDTGETKADYYVSDAGVGAAINLRQLENASSYSYYIELVNWNDASQSYDVVGRSTTASTYASLVGSNFIDTGDNILPIQSVTVWHGGTYSVPEPTSAIMVMMWLGLLALKRKKA